MMTLDDFESQNRPTDRIQEARKSLSRDAPLQSFRKGHSQVIKAGVINKKMTFLIIGSSSRKGQRYYEPYLTRKGVVCNGSEGPCEHYQRYSEGKEDRNCSHCLMVENKIMKGLVEFRGRPITSDMAFQEICNSGVINKDEAEVLSLIRLYPDMTAVELHRLWNDERRAVKLSPKRLSTIVGRISDLKKLLYLASSGLRKNADSGHTANTWVISWKGDGT